MAKLTPHGWSGAIGNIIFFTLNGKQYGKAVPIRVRQTDATKASASKFGLAAIYAKCIRIRLQNLLAPINNLTMRNRLTSAVYEWILGKPADTGGSFVPVYPLLGFDYNEQAPMRKYMTKTIQADWSRPGIVTINIPAIEPMKDIKAPRNKSVSSIDLWVCVTGFSTHDMRIRSSRPQMIQIPYKEGGIAPKEIELLVDISLDGMAALNMGLIYNIAGVGGVLPDNNPKWRPASIVEAFFKGSLANHRKLRIL